MLSARIAYGMGSYRALPGFLSNVSRRFSTPAIASIVVGVLLIGIFWVYMLATSVQNAFYDVIDTTGLLFAIFYILTAFAVIVYYRRRVFSGVWDFVTLGLLPLGAAGFLGWMFEQTLQTGTSWATRWSLIGIVALGLVLMLSARVSPALAVLPDPAGERAGNGARLPSPLVSAAGWGGLLAHDGGKAFPRAPGDRIGRGEHALAPRHRVLQHPARVAQSADRVIDLAQAQRGREGYPGGRCP